MSTESSKVVWITVAVAAFVLVVAIAGVFLFYPRNQAPAAPATVGNTAAPKPLDPQDYLNAPAALPTETKRNGDVIVIYGDKPQDIPPLPADGAAQGLDQGATAPAPLDNGAGAAATQSPPAAAAPVGTAQPAPPAAKTLSAPAPSAPAKSVAKPAPGPKPAASATKTSVPAKPAATGQYWIQAASFTERAKADSLREGLAAKGIAALIAVKDIKGQSWYRVRVGPYSSDKEAKGWLSKVKLVKGCEEAFVSAEALKP